VVSEIEAGETVKTFVVGSRTAVIETSEYGGFAEASKTTGTVLEPTMALTSPDGVLVMGDPPLVT